MDVFREEGEGGGAKGLDATPDFQRENQNKEKTRTSGSLNVSN